jgi:sugar-specific transcriptional regulator TrmB
MERHKLDKTEVLKRFGLTDKEIRVFLANLELGQTTVNEIAKRSNIFRTYCYDILKSLMEKGLVTYIIKSGVKYFETVEPERLIDILHEREDMIRSILPDLKGMRTKTVEKPKVEFYEGKEGIKTIHEDVIKTRPKEVLVYSNTTRYYEVMQWYFPRYIKERVKNGIRTRVITEKSKLTIEKIKRGEKKELRQTRFFPKRFTAPTSKFIYKNKIAMVSLGKNITGVVIENEDMAKGDAMAFELMWEKAER